MIRLASYFLCGETGDDGSSRRPISRPCEPDKTFFGKGIVMTATDPDPTEVPADIEKLYEGQWIAWDTVTREVAGHGATLDEAMINSDLAFQAGHELYYHHILPANTVIVGGL